MSRDATKSPGRSMLHGAASFLGRGLELPPRSGLADDHDDDGPDDAAPPGTAPPRIITALTAQPAERFEVAFAAQVQRGRAGR
jgi:hypothetical protein